MLDRVVHFGETGRKMERRNQKKILVVDSDLLSIVHISLTLLTGGYVISHATDYQTALKAVKKEKPDLIICTIGGSDLDSHRLVNTVHGERAFRTIPFLFVVESGQESDQAPEILGPKQYLTKPFTREQLAAAVQQHLGEKRHQLIS